MGLLMGMPSGQEPLQLNLVKVEHAVILWPDCPIEPPFYDDCAEAQAVVAAAGAGVVVSKGYYETDWVTHVPHV